MHSLGAGGVTLAGLDATHRLEATLDNVVIDGLKPGDITARHALLTLRHGNVEPTGEDLHLTGAAGGGPVYSCEAKFVPFPENTSSPVSAELIPPPDNTFYVAADGTGDYYSVQAALNKVPASGGLVLVAPGSYRERLLITQSHVTLKSANADPSKTIIVFDLSRGTQGQQQGTATVRVRGDDFTAENITFENDFNAGHKQEPQGSQAPALNLMGDRNVLRNVRILGNEDTLVVAAKNCNGATGSSCEPARSYFNKCYIAGNVSFIQGDGTAYFDDCEIHSTAHDGVGFITAQGKHYMSQESIFVFRNCRLTADSGVTNVVLGKPWRDFSSVVFLNPVLGSHISAAGWREWQPPNTHRLETAFFRVYKPTGPGAGIGGLTLTPQEAARYTPARSAIGQRQLESQRQSLRPSKKLVIGFAA